jgi:hypothetical protein
MATSSGRIAGPLDGAEQRFQRFFVGGEGGHQPPSSATPARAPRSAISLPGGDVDLGRHFQRFGKALAPAP